MSDYRVRGRAEHEAWEAQRLAPYAATAATSRGRRHPQPAGDPRLPYQRDRDRVLHSGAFRRLQYKTQVFVFHEGDFYRTRLTHSLEVAQIGQTLARMVGANDDLVEAISLAHDLGHPPFGHAGEEELAALTAQSGGFEHNLQALRIVDGLEAAYPAFPGLNLTWEAREGIARHATFFDAPDPPAEFAGHPQPGLEAQLSSVADMIAYCTHDLEDALSIGFVTEGELLEKVALWRLAVQEAKAAGGAGPAYGDQPLAARDAERRFRIRTLIDLLAWDAARETLRRLARRAVRRPDDVRASEEPVAGFCPEVEARLGELKDFLYQRVYRDPRTVRMAHKARMILRSLFTVFLQEPGMLPRSAQERAAVTGDLQRVVCDHLALMTDRHAMDLYNTLYEPYESSLRGL